MIKVKKAQESGGTFLMFFNKCLFMCLHVEISLERLFKSFSLELMMWNFSVRHRLHNLLPLTKGREWSIISHDNRGWMLRFWRLQIYFDNSVEFTLSSCRKVKLCWLQQVLNAFLVRPIYLASSSADFQLIWWCICR